MPKHQAFIDTWTWDDRANAGYGEILENAVGRFQPQTVELIKGLHAVLQEGNLSNEYVTPKVRMGIQGGLAIYRSILGVQP